MNAYMYADYSEPIKSTYAQWITQKRVGGFQLCTQQSGNVAAPPTRSGPPFESKYEYSQMLE